MKIAKKLALLLLVLGLASCNKTDNNNKTKQETKVEDTKNVEDENKNETSSENKTDEDTKKEDKAFQGKYIVDTNYLSEKIGKEDVIIIHARGEEAKKGHVKGAIAMTWQDIANVANNNPGDEGWGHILAPDELSKKLGELGIDKNKEIILYSTANAGWGEDGRILWELKTAGFDNLKMVDGGYQAIEKAGIETDKEEVKLDPVEVEISNINRENVIDTKELTENIKNYKIVDSREKEEYDGAVLYGEAKGGHLPGAVNVPYSSLYNEDGFLKSNDEIEKIFEDLGFNKDDEIVTYCTGGIRSAYMQLVLEMLGYNKVKNYEGSYYNWAKVNEVEK